MSLCKIVVILSCLSIFICQDQEFDENEIRRHLGNKTPYRIIYDKNGSIDTENAKCAKKIWMLVGHGTSYPSEEDLSEMNNRLLPIKNKILKAFAGGNTMIHRSKLPLFREWLPHPSEEYDTLKLVPEGEKEMQDLASRMQAKYPKLLPNEFKNTTYLFKYIGEDTIRESARYFALGLFGRKNIRKAFFPQPTDDDLRIIRPWRNCMKWMDEIKSNPEADIEKDSFFNGKFISKAVDEVTQNVGINKLTKEDVRAMYLACAYETAWSRYDESPWCTVFGVSSIKAFEYLDDLELYWLRGYGYKISHEQACLGMKDALLFFNNRRIGRKSSIYFTDTESVASFVAHLGLYKTIPLTHNNYDPGIERPWRSSRIGSFATNLALILYACNGTKFISVFHNEQFVQIPACPQSNTCDFEKFKKYYRQSVNHCNFDDICESED